MLCRHSNSLAFILVLIAAPWAHDQGASRSSQAAPQVTEVPPPLREALKLDPFYKKHLDYRGYPILSSDKVSDAALIEARYLISQMLADRDDILQAIIKRKCRFVVMAPTEMTTDVPEQRHLKDDPKTDWDKRAPGLGGRITSCGEENLLNLKGDRYRNENILIHEFAHCIQNYGLRMVDPSFNDRLRAAYSRAMEKKLWEKTYAATNAGEYWAEAVQSYFDCNAPPGGVHNDINTREKLAKYDPELFQLIDEVFRQSTFRYVRYDKRFAKHKNDLTTVEQTKERTAAANHRVIRVTEPDAAGAVEVSVAINPTNPDHIVAVSIQRGKKGQQFTSNYAYVSTDAGRTWKTAAHANPGQRTQGDDVVIFTGDGLAVRAYIAFVGIRVPRPTRAFSGIFVTTSRDGLAWGEPAPVIDHVNSVEPHEDKPWLCADKSKDSPHRGNIYIAWTKFDVYGSKNPEHKTHVFFSRSRDQGKSFSVPHRISALPGDCLDSSKTLMGAVPAVGPKGEVYVVWAGPQGLVFDQSTDGGFKFTGNKVIADTPGGWDFPIKGLGRCNGLPMLSVDLSTGKDRGSIYVNWADLRHGDPDVFLSASRDGGVTWSKPLRVNDDPQGNGKEQFFTWMAVDPVDGSVNIAFYDRRDLDGPRTGLTLARSVDGGRSFVNYKINHEPFECDPRAFFGDYLGIDAHGGRVVVAYQHFMDTKKLAISAAVFEFEPGRQSARKAATN
jgi:hypothetical protein